MASRKTGNRDKRVRGPHYHMWKHKQGPHPALDFDYCTKCHLVVWRNERSLQEERR